MIPKTCKTYLKILKFENHSILLANLPPFNSVFRKSKIPQQSALKAKQSKFNDHGQPLQKKRQIPRRLAQTDKDFGQITFFFCILLSHKLLSDRFGDFQYCQKIKLIMTNQMKKKLPVEEYYISCCDIQFSFTWDIVICFIL